LEDFSMRRVHDVHTDSNSNGGGGDGIAKVAGLRELYGCRQLNMKSDSQQDGTVRHASVVAATSMAQPAVGSNFKHTTDSTLAFQAPPMAALSLSMSPPPPLLGASPSPSSLPSLLRASQLSSSSSAARGAVLLCPAAQPITAWEFDAVLVLLGGQWPARGLVSGCWPPCEHMEAAEPPSPPTNMTSGMNKDDTGKNGNNHEDTVDTTAGLGIAARGSDECTAGAGNEARGWVAASQSSGEWVEVALGLQAPLLHGDEGGGCLSPSSQVCRSRSSNAVSRSSDLDSGLVDVTSGRAASVGNSSCDDDGGSGASSGGGGDCATPRPVQSLQPQSHTTSTHHASAVAVSPVRHVRVGPRTCWKSPHRAHHAHTYPLNHHPVPPRLSRDTSASGAAYACVVYCASIRQQARVLRLQEVTPTHVAGCAVDRSEPPVINAHSTTMAVPVHLPAGMRAAAAVLHAEVCNTGAVMAARSQHASSQHASSHQQQQLQSFPGAAAPKLACEQDVGCIVRATLRCAACQSWAVALVNW
jgi:hypothetical protein